MNKGNMIKAVLATAVILVAVFLLLKYSTNVLESAPAGSPGADPGKYSPGQKPKAD